MNTQQKFINLTGRDINVYVGKDLKGVITMPASGAVPVASIERQTVNSVDGIPIKKQIVKKVVGIPPPVDGVFYITSNVVCQAARRPDVVSPDEIVRDGNGMATGCKSLALCNSL